MEIKPLDFLIGLSLGLALGVGGTMLVSRIRGWLGRSEIGRLRAENRVLARAAWRTRTGTSVRCWPRPSAWRSGWGRRAGDLRRKMPVEKN